MPTDSIKFDRAAGFYDETRGFPPGIEQQAATLIARVGGLEGSQRVLEIGVGTGRIAIPLARHTGTYFGIDLSRPMMERLQEKQTGTKIYPVEGDATRLPYRAGSFDAAITVHVFHLIPDWRAALREIARVLAPCKPLVTAWNDNTLKEALAGRGFQMPEMPVKHVGVHFEQMPSFLEDEDWQPVGPTQQVSYQIERSLTEYLNALENRIWSVTWQMTDEQLSRVIEKARQQIKQFADPGEPVKAEGMFNARAYLPPAS